MAGDAKRKDSTIAFVVGIVTLIVALVFAVLFLVGINFTNLIISLKDFVPAKGLANSPWIGLDNYIKIIQTPGFVGSMFLYPAISSASTLVLSLLAGYLLLVIGRIKWLRHALCTLLLIPLIVPGELWFGLFLQLGLVSGDTQGVLPAVLYGSLKYVGITSLLVSASIGHGNRKWHVPLLSGGIFFLFQFALLGRFDFSFLARIPAFSFGIAGVDVYIYRTAYMYAQFGVGSTAEVLRSLGSGILLAIAAWPAAAMLKLLFPAGCQAEGARIKDRLISLALPGAIVLAAAACLAVAAFSSGVNANELQLYTVYPLYIVIAFCAAAFNTVLCYLLARPLACSGKAGKAVMTAVLVLLTAMGLSAVPVGEFMMFRPMGMVGTWFAVALSGIGCVWGVWPLAFAAKGLGVNTNTDWFKIMWKPSLALFAVQAMFLMNNAVPSMIYMSRVNDLHPLLNAFMNMNGGDSMFNLALLALVTLAVPVALLLIVRTALSEKDSLGLFLPGR